jgi:Domain of unknown function (DUF4178)
MKRFACPSCGAEVAFRSSVSIYAVCPYCESMLVRTDVAVEAIGRMAALPDDMSPLQIGTEGRYDNEHFAIIGRLKVGWRDGMWNEWHVLTDGGRRGWIAEAQGSFAISFDVEGGLDEHLREVIAGRLAVPAPGDAASGGGAVAAGFEIVLDGTWLRAVDVKDATCLGSEGELPFAAPKGRRSLNIDFLGRGGEFATVEVEGETYRAFKGSYVEWDQFRFANLRPLEGWA